MSNRFLPSHGSLLFLLVAACSAASGSAALDGGSPSDGAGGPDAASDAPGDAPYSDGSLADGSLGVACSGAPSSFANDVHPILQRSCSGGEICHSGIGPAWSYPELVNAPATRDCASAGVVVTPGDLEKSYLVHKLTGVGMCAGTDRMPRGGQPLAEAEIQKIADWICKGAAND